MGPEFFRGFVRDLQFGTFEAPGLLAKAATVTPPGGAPVQTAVIWVNQSEAGPTGAQLQREEHRRFVAIRSDHVPAVPRGTLIAGTAPLEGEPIAWVADSTVSDAPDHRMIAVLPAPLDT